MEEYCYGGQAERDMSLQLLLLLHAIFLCKPRRQRTKRGDHIGLEPTHELSESL